MKALQQTNGDSAQLYIAPENHFRIGNHKRVWDATGLASGVYLYRLQAGDPSTSSPNKSGQAGQRFVKVIKLALVR